MVVARLLHPGLTQQVSTEVIAERTRQDTRWGEQDHLPLRWLSILVGEVGEAAAEINGDLEGEGYSYDHAQRLRAELIQVAAVAQAMVECGDRNGWWPRGEA